MIQVFGQDRAGRVTPKGVAALLVCWLNLLLLPCAMALETPEDAHDCCPPEIEWQQLDCCDIVAAAAEKRDDSFTQDGELVVLPAAAIPPQPRALPPDRLLPPWSPPPGGSPALHKLFCVYLD